VVFPIAVVSKALRGYNWPYVVTRCELTFYLQKPIKHPDRFQWQDVKTIDHYYLSVDDVTQSMQVREPTNPYGQ